MDPRPDHVRDPADELAQDRALMRAMFAQDRIGIVFHDLDLRVSRANAAAETCVGVPLPPGIRLHEVISEPDAVETEAALRQVLDTGVPLIGHEQQIRTTHIPGRRQTALFLSIFRLEDSFERPTGVALVFTYTSPQHLDRRRELQHSASVHIGRSLDVSGAAQELADVLVPAFGDTATVELAEAVLEGDEPWRIGDGDQHRRRVAVASADRGWPDRLLGVGDLVPPLPDAPAIRRLQRGEAVSMTGENVATLLGDPELAQRLVPPGARSVLAAPLISRGLLLGSVMVWRSDATARFDREDADLLSEIASRAAATIDNARRYTREHRVVTALQQRLLPRATSDSTAVETSGLYVPAGGEADISGDWFDVIPLPSLRVALVVGDVFGHGLHATATMGRLRTAVQSLADLELAPDELLTHVDDLVQRLADETEPAYQDAVGATILYLVYDPVSRMCQLASAGHPPPVLVRPDGSADLVEVAPGPPLGVGGMPFEVTGFRLEPGSVLGLYSDGLIGLGGQDMEAGAAKLAEGLAALCGGPEGAEASLETVGHSLLAGTADPPPRDDVTLLLARTRELSAESTALWEFPADPAVVSEARQAASGQIAAWGLDHLSFTTELVVSELVTNAVRYAGGPVQLRLIRDEVLICEVSDPSNTQPRLRRALTTDEGGRGLFLVAQLARRWGSRYGHSGKTIWAEQSLDPADSRLLALADDLG